MRILVSNDDGIHAPGLKILEKVARSLSKDVWVVAPEYEQSGASHSLTLTLPLRLRKINARKYAVRGTPTDCVMMAMHEIFKDKRPDLLLSGVNRGANLGEDVTYSGTVAVAMEGSLLGVPSIALSQCFQHGHPVKWGTAEHHAPKVIKKLLKTGWAKDTLINVNFPDVVADSVTGIEVVPQGKRDLTDLLLDARVDARNVPYYWIGFRRQKDKYKRHTDLGATEAGAISVTPLQLDLTHKTGMKALKAALA
ncbi:MAG: 5'/3'-nucleotidase SurE [Alphaproteobacteria bacterium]|nr:5'/3'-nucleotidase SurE [Alphaproteobacteria bacterium]